MPVHDLFSKRQKRLRGDVHDVYVYDNIPYALRVQIVHIWSRYIGPEDKYNSRYEGHRYVRIAYDEIAQDLCQEYGYFQLRARQKFRWRRREEYPRNRYQEIVRFILREKDVERVLDAVELSVKCIKNRRTQIAADSVIEELNVRFREHGVGFQFLGGQIVRVDSEYVHSEAIKPAIRLLYEKRYAGAQQEFLSAHQHYRKRETKEALNDCLKAFESVMKAICDKRGWSYPRNATASALVDVCLKNELIPSFWQSQYSGLRTLLESGVPTGRNKLSGHGQGTAPVEVPGHIAAYMLHMTASAIVFLAEAEAQLK